MYCDYVCSCPPHDNIYVNIELGMLSVDDIPVPLKRLPTDCEVSKPCLAFIASILHQGKCVMMPHLCC